MQLQLRGNVQGVLPEEVRAGIADFGIGDVAAPHPSLITEPLRQETFHVTLPRDHPLARRKPIRMAELRGEPLLSMPVEAGIRRLIDGAAEAAGISVAYDITVNQFPTDYTLSRGGVGNVRRGVGLGKKGAISVD